MQRREALRGLAAAAGAVGALTMINGFALAEKKEHHPHIHRAIEDLREAKKELKEANHDFGGHREKALQECNEAIEHLELALKFDKK